MSKLISLLSRAFSLFFLLNRYDPIMRIGSSFAFICLGKMVVLPLISILTVKLFDFDLSLSIGPENKLLFDIAIFIGFIFGLVLIGVSFWSNQKNCKNLLIKITGMPGMETQSIDKCLTKNFRVGLRHIPLDFIDCYQGSMVVNPQLMIRRINGLPDQISTAVKDQNRDVHVLLGGLAPVPILVQAGYKITDRQNLTLIDRTQVASDWYIVKGFDDGLEPEVNKNIDDTREDLSIIISLSVKVSVRQIPKNLQKSYVTIDLGDSVARDSISSEQKQKRIVQQFNEICSNIRGEYPNIKTIHVFMASQASFAVRLGTKITTSVMPEIKVYNFDSATNSYSWYVKFEHGQEPKYFQTETSHSLGITAL